LIKFQAVHVVQDVSDFVPPINKLIDNSLDGRGLVCLILSGKVFLLDMYPIDKSPNLNQNELGKGCKFTVDFLYVGLGEDSQEKEALSRDVPGISNEDFVAGQKLIEIFKCIHKFPL
jgi:hypothetical protein